MLEKRRALFVDRTETDRKRRKGIPPLGEMARLWSSEDTSLGYLIECGALSEPYCNACGRFQRRRATRPTMYRCGSCRKDTSIVSFLLFMLFFLFVVVYAFFRCFYPKTVLTLMETYTPF